MNIHKTQFGLLFQLALSALLLASVSAAPSGPAPLGPILPPVYNYNYAVKDDYSGSIFTAAEERDNYNAAGSYSVNLPDGRVQIVSYSVSGPDGGYIADVKYEGVASYAPVAAKPYVPAPAPVYKPKPAPVYKPAPVPVYKPAPLPAIVPAYKPVAPKPVSPVYKPAPAPVYKPAPAPVYHRAPVYQAAAPSTRKYSYTVIAPEAPAALPVGAARTARIEPDLVILNENSIEEEIILDAPVEVPTEEIIAVIEDAEIAFEEPAAPIVEASALIEEAIEEAIEEVIEVAAPIEAAAPIEEAAPVEEIPAEETIIEALETVEEEIAEIEAEEIGSTEETPAAAPVEEAAPAPAAPARFRFFRRFF